MPRSEPLGRRADHPRPWPRPLSPSLRPAEPNRGRCGRRPHSSGRARPPCTARRPGPPGARTRSHRWRDGRRLPHGTRRTPVPDGSYTTPVRPDRICSVRRGPEPRSPRSGRRPVETSSHCSTVRAGQGVRIARHTPPPSNADPATAWAGGAEAAAVRGGGGPRRRSARTPETGQLDLRPESCSRPQGALRPVLYPGDPNAPSSPGRHCPAGRIPPAKITS